ncbi:MAG: hypothetical protein HYZ58_17530 [Acidobacteria bacterium]|nr:hypothetical protein [Acidobacteriota bacterium]
MREMPGLRSVLKRSAVITAACWPVVLIQFVSESVFKILLAVPVLAGAFLASILIGRSAGDLASGDLREAATAVAASLLGRPVALAAFIVALLVVVLGGSALMFLIKGGTVVVLLVAESSANWLEPSGVMHVFRSAMQFSVARFTSGAERLARRFLALGTMLIVAYTLVGGVYVAVVLGGYAYAGGRALVLGWTVVAAICSGILVVAITLVNLFYLLIQIVMAVEDRGIVASARQVLRFLHADIRDVAGVFLIVVCLVVVAMAASLFTTAAIGFIAFVPIAALIVLPAQAGAWLLRSLVFQYLGLTALTSYATFFRAYASLVGQADPHGHDK